MKLNQYIEIINLDKQQFDSTIDYQVEVISIYNDQDPDEVYNWFIDEIASKYRQILKEISSYRKPKDLIHLEGYNFYKKPFEKLTLGEWIDLDYYLSNNMFVEAIIVLYRLKQEEVMSDDIWEPYGSFIDKRKPLFLNVNTVDVIGIIKEFVEWRENFILANKDLFYVEQPEEDISNLSHQELQELKKAEHIEKNKKKFAWEKLIMDLANGDITKFNQIVELPLILIFNIKSMLKTYE